MRSTGGDMEQVETGDKQAISMERKTNDSESWIKDTTSKTQSIEPYNINFSLS